MVRHHPIDDLQTRDLLEAAGEIDEALAYIVKASTVSPSLSIQRRLAKLLTSAWKGAASTALDSGIGPLLAKKPTKTSVRVFVASLGKKLSAPLTVEQIEVLRSQIERIWKIAKKIKAREVKVAFRFDLVDKKAVQAINRQQVFWVGDFYSDKLSARIQAVSEDVMLQQGFDRREAGRQLRRAVRQEFGLISGGRSGFAPNVPARYAGNPELYFEGVASTASHQARTFGAMTAFKEAGIKTFRLDNPNDERTGKICQEMHGQTFSVPVGVKQMDKVLGATSPPDVKDIAPWLGAGEIEDLKSSGGLEAAGVILPPFHHLCRTEVIAVG